MKLGQEDRAAWTASMVLNSTLSVQSWPYWLHGSLDITTLSFVGHSSPEVQGRAMVKETRTERMARTIVVMRMTFTVLLAINVIFKIETNNQVNEWLEF